MTNHVLLNNVTHKSLKVITERSAQYGDNVACTGVFPFEFRQVQSEYPIVFRKSENFSGFEPIALLGLEEKENLFLKENHWDAKYVPLTIQRQPFLIGFQNNSEAGMASMDPVVHMDLDSPRISESEGESVFLEHGGNSPYLDHMASVLQAIHSGHISNKGFSEVLVGLDLLETFSLEVELENGIKQKLVGFYTINEENLSKIDNDSIIKLYKSGWLEHIHMTIASLANFRALIDRKNKLLSR